VCRITHHYNVVCRQELREGLAEEVTLLLDLNSNAKMEGTRRREKAQVRTEVGFGAWTVLVLLRVLVPLLQSFLSRSMPKVGLNLFQVQLEVKGAGGMM
jgi:hypothetical protein